MPSSIYKTAEGAARMEALYDEALAALGVGYESRRVDTRSGETHVLVIGPEEAPPVIFLPGGNFLNPTCLRWFLPLARSYRLYTPESSASRAGARNTGPPQRETVTPSGSRTCSTVSTSDVRRSWASLTEQASL